MPGLESLWSRESACMDVPDSQAWTIPASRPSVRLRRAWPDFLPRFACASLEWS